MSDHQLEMEPLRQRDSAGLDWEEISIPEPSAEHEHLVPPQKTSQQDQARPLCGYLHKLSYKGPIKTWRTRWFVFDDRKCCLYYYNYKTDSSPAGKIEISSATLTYDVENLSKFQFEIASEGRLVSLQASSHEAMFYWLTALQKKRRRFSARRKKALTDNIQEAPTKTGGLISESSDPAVAMETSDDMVLEAPCNLEDRSAFNPRAPTNRWSWVQNLPQKFKGPSFNLGGTSPTTQKRTTSVSPAVGGTPTQTTPTGGKSSEPSPEHPVPPTEPVDIRNPKPSPRNITNRLSLKFSGVRKQPSCPRCQQLQESVATLEAELSLKDREVKDRDEINEFLRNEIHMTDLKAKVTRDLSEPSDPNGSMADSKIDVLVQREQTIEQLQHLLEEAISERDRVTTELDAKRLELEALGEQVALYKEAVTAKDHVVVDLTNKLFKLEHNGQIPNDPKDAMLPSSTQDELKKAQEAVEAYRRQNQFLSSEILELNAVRSEDLETYRITSSKYHELEANFLKVQSKYMILLQESQTPRMGSETGPSPELVSQMLEEALQTEDNQRVTKERSSSFDQYGFSQGQAALDQDLVAEPLVMKARKLDQQAQVIKDTMASTIVKWDNYFSSHGEPSRSYEMKALIRGGIPRVYRTKMWQWMVRHTVGKKFVEGQYQAILQQHAGQSSVAVNQIELDLLRTLPTNKYYDKPDAQGINKLRRVLVAFSWYDSNVGYCQGLNRLAAIALLFLEEEDAFWCLVAIVHHLLPRDYYSKTLLGSQTDQRVLRELLQEKAPKLNSHLGLCDIDFSLITFNWFHTIYVDNLPVETMLRIWDTFLYEGSKVLFRFALAIFRSNEEELLACATSITIFNKLRTLCQNATDIDRLVQIAFFELNPFPMKKINTHRTYYRQVIKEELDALDVLRSQAPPIAPPTRETREQSKDDDSDVEETIFLT